MKAIRQRRERSCLNWAASDLLGALLVGVISLCPASVLAQDAPEVSAGKVDAKLDRGDDQRVAKRLRATFGTLESLSAVEVEVEAGVVSLSGIVDSGDASNLARELAQQIEGVVAVESEIEENRSVERRVDLALERLRERAWSLIDQLPLLIVAIAVVFASIFFGRLVTRWDGLFRWLTDSVFLRDLLRQVVRLSIFVGGALMALEVLDATALVGAVLGAAGVAGLAIGFAFRDLVENYLASILLSLRRPFAPNDFVRIEGHEGLVARLTSRATILVTPEGNHVRIPNGVVFKAVIENVTRNPNRRFSFGVAVGVDEDLISAQDLGTEILREMKGILDDPEPFCRVEELGDSSVTLTFFGWVDQGAVDFGKVRSEAIRLVKQAFDRKEIEMPEPIHRLRVETMPEFKKEKKAPTSVGMDQVRDISIDRHIDRVVAAEQASEEPDLLRGAGGGE